jgi:hypothetical protein
VEVEEIDVETVVSVAEAVGAEAGPVVTFMMLGVSAEEIVGSSRGATVLVAVAVAVAVAIGSFADSSANAVVTFASASKVPMEASKGVLLPLLVLLLLVSVPATLVGVGASTALTERMLILAPSCMHTLLFR